MRIDLWADDFDFDSYVAGLVTLRPMTAMEAFQRFETAHKRNGAIALWGQWSEAIKRCLKQGKVIADFQSHTIRRVG